MNEPLATHSRRRACRGAPRQRGRPCHRRRALSRRHPDRARHARSGPGAQPACACPHRHIDLAARARRPRRGRRDHGRRYSRQERHRADPQRRAGACRRYRRIRGPAGGGNRRDDARSGARGGKAGRDRLRAAPRRAHFEEAMARESFVSPPQLMARGEVEPALAAAPHRLSGELRCGGQDHFYLEGQIALAMPGEAGDMQLYELDPASDRSAARRRASASGCRSTRSPSRCGAWAARSAARRARRPSSPASPPCSPGRRGGR